MKFLQCSHPPHTMKITFDIGDNQISEYTLCKNCKNVPVFRDFILSKETIPENNKTAEVRFSHITSANTSPTKEMIT